MPPSPVPVGISCGRVRGSARSYTAGPESLVLAPPSGRSMQNTPASQLKFVTEAIAQICECRRILKWTYSFGFYNMLARRCARRSCNRPLRIWLWHSAPAPRQLPHRCLGAKRMQMRPSGQWRKGCMPQDEDA